jgi:cytochrome c-type biogenesis protein CcmH
VSASGTLGSLSSQKGAWVALVVVGLLALGIGLFVNEGSARTTEERTTNLAESVKCPTCRSQSVAESEAPIAREIRADIANRLEAGESDDDIRDYLVSRYGQEILLTPPSSGVAGLVWVIPVVAVVLAGVGLWFAFRRWQEAPTVHASSADRDLVEAALHPDHADAPEHGTGS